MNNIAHIKAHLADLNTRIAMWDQKVEEEFGHLWQFDNLPDEDSIFDEVDRLATAKFGVRPDEELLPVLDELCDSYLAAVPDQRHDIRSFLEHKTAVLMAFYGYIGRAERLLSSSRDVRWLRRGLAAASIDDMRTDWRDTKVALSGLYHAAVAAGIDPQLHFAEVAAMSNTALTNRTSRVATREFLANFRAL